MIFRNKKIVALIGIFILVIIFLPINFAQAADTPSGSWWAGALSWIFLLIANALGVILTFILDLVNRLFIELKDFDPSGKVTYGWTIVRDLCNMFFILVLLVIAFATILRIENYNVKKTLPKLLIMAVLINFSKTICFFLIDFSQVIMLTFANGFAGAPGNFVNALGLQNLEKISDKAELGAIPWEMFGAVVLVLIIIVITIIVMVMLLAILIMRLIMFWILTILSPIAFLAFAIPGAEKYTAQWWGEFTKYLIIGPVLAFFVWLALVIATEASAIFEIKNGKFDATTILKIGESGNLLQFVLVIGLLIGALKISQQLGVMGGSIGMNMANAIKSRGLGMARKAALAPVKGAGKLGKNVGGWGLDKVSSGLGIDLNVVDGYKRVKAQMDKNKRDRKQNLRDKVLETADETGGPIKSRLAQFSTGDLMWRNISNWRKGGLKSFGKSGKWRTQQFEDIKQEQGKIEGLKKQRSGVLSNKEGIELINNKKEKEKELKDVDEKIKHQKEIRDDESRSFDERDKAKHEIKSLEELESGIKKEIGIMAGQIKNINNPEAKRLDEEIKDSNSNIKLNEEQLEKYKKGGMWEARKETAAALMQEQGKAADYTDNSQELGQMIVDAIKNGQQGLVSVIAKKMTRNGDYNEMQKVLGLGTGREGMLGLAKILQTQGGFSQQAALGLVGEVGNIAKNIKHFGAFGATIMENGRWRESSEDEYEAAKYTEMSKVQKQAFARDTGRLGLGHYEKMEGDGDDWEHDKKHWVLDKSTIALFKDPAYAQHYDSVKGTANASAIGHLALDVNVDILEKNGATGVARNVKGRQDRSEVDPMVAVRSVAR